MPWLQRWNSSCDAEQVVPDGKIIPLAWAMMLAIGPETRARSRDPVVDQVADTVPQATVWTSFRSVTGRTLYLILRPEHGEGPQLHRPIRRMVDSVSASLEMRAAGRLWLAAIRHPTRSLVLHRHGRHLRLTLGPPPSDTDMVAPPLASGLRLRLDRSDEEVDLEILLKSRNALRDREQVPGGLVAMAQAAAARDVLHRYISGDDVGAALWGRRHMPLLQAHPDAMLLTEIVSCAWEALSVPLPSRGSPPPSAGTPLPASWAAALSSAEETALRARRALDVPSAAQAGPGVPRRRSKPKEGAVPPMEAAPTESEN
ncbi:MAG: hypothetical protein RMK29_14020 [Myxococcales bacterium]|nr:hypothetical protein [Myxococcota bacterium]MDW8282827.1 hypothetical protein [Myxococcales bacterium]